MGFSLINHPFWVPLFSGNLHIPKIPKVVLVAPTKCPTADGPRLAFACASPLGGRLWRGAVPGPEGTPKQVEISAR